MPSRPQVARVIWFTGLSGAGKSTLAKLLAETLRRQGEKVEELDGDSIRAIFPQTGFSKAERNSHIQRVGYMASRLESHGITVIVSLISPYQESRNFVRGLCKKFTEVYLSTPISVCQERDTKGLYKKVKSGELKNFTGIDAPYEIPTAAELTLDTSSLNVQGCLEQLLKAIR